MINRTKTLKGRKLQFQHDGGQTNLLLFSFPMHRQWNIRCQTWSFVAWSAPTAYHQSNRQCLTSPPPNLVLGLGPGTTFAMWAPLLLIVAIFPNLKHIQICDTYSMADGYHKHWQRVPNWKILISIVAIFPIPKKFQIWSFCSRHKTSQLRLKPTSK